MIILFLFFFLKPWWLVQNKKNTHKWCNNFKDLTLELPLKPETSGKNPSNLHLLPGINGLFGLLLTSAMVWGDDLFKNTKIDVPVQEYQLIRTFLPWIRTYSIRMITRCIIPTFLPWHVPSYAISIIIDYQGGKFLKFEWCLWTIMASVSGEHVFWCWSFGKAGKIWWNQMTWLGKTREIWDANLTFVMAISW